MPFLTPQDKFNESPEEYNLKMAQIWVVVLFLISIWGFLQTKQFVTLLPPLELGAIRQEMATSQQVQARLVEDYTERGRDKHPTGIIFHYPLFNEKQLEILNYVKQLLEGDQQLEQAFKEKFGISLRNANVVVVPAWRMHGRDNNSQFGLTPVGWDKAKVRAGDPNVPGFVIRDHVPNDAPVTFSGIPRIALNLEAFESPETLRLTLFHELVHSVNIPGYHPSLVTILQTDLTYLYEYRDYVDREGLEGWRQYIIWIVWVILPIVSAALIFRYIRRRKALLNSAKMARG